MTHLQSLIAKAKAATDGPWRAYDCVAAGPVFGGKSNNEVAIKPGLATNWENDRLFIASCNPHLILALCELAMAAEEVIEHGDLHIEAPANERLVRELALKDKLAAVRGVSDG
jgi:hypothetical protein